MSKYYKFIEKYGGIIEVNEALIEKIMAYVRAAYSESMLRFLEYDEIYSNIKMLNTEQTDIDKAIKNLNIVKAYLKKDLLEESITGKTIEINSGRIEQAGGRSINFELRIKMFGEPGVTNYYGRWTPYNNILDIVNLALKDYNHYDYLITIDAINKSHKEIESFVRHEVRHLIQNMIEGYKNLNDIGGLPSKHIRDIEYDISGYPIRGKGERLVSTLRDDEFYTYLGNEIDSYKMAANKIPKILHGLFIKYWVDEIGINKFKELSNIEIIKHGYNEEDIFRLNKIIDKINISNFFRLLKENQIKKYEKAVKEFTKAINI